MPVYVSVLTGKGYGAIGSVLLYGRGAEAILSNVFTSAVSHQTGGIFHGHIIEDGKILDDAVVGCEGENHFAVHCHGNPILVQKIVQLLVRRGAQLIPFEEISFSDSSTLIGKEASVEQLKAVTIEGVKIIQSQITGGLSEVAKKWMSDSVSIQGIHKQCREILEHSQIARRIISGVKIVLAGPANSGKSTLLNTLAGGPKAIISEIAGTTRDWVSAFIHIGPLRAEVIDTAGLGENAVRDAVDRTAQERTLELIRQCDCVLWIEDGSLHKGGSDRGEAEVDGRAPVSAIHLPPVGGCHPPTIEVWNKSDLSAVKSPQEQSGTVRISAKTGQGIDALLTEIQKRLLVCDLDYMQPAAFTDRQKTLLEAIAVSGQKEQILGSLVQLLE